MIAIRSAVSADIPAIIGVMAGAFENAVLYRYFEPNCAKHAELLQMIFSHRITHIFTASDVDVAADAGRIIGAAVWVKPRSPEPPALEEASPVNEALEEAVRRYDGAVYERWRHFHEILFASLDAVCSEPHWSLAPIAVIPEAQKQGVGGALIRHKLADIDASGAPCLLATQDEANRARYARYGWKPAGRTHISGDMYSYAMLYRLYGL